MLKLIVPEEIEETNVTPMKLVTGGKDGGQGWLVNLPAGTAFLCKKKPNAIGQKNVILEEYVVFRKVDNNGVHAVQLYSSYSQPEYMWVDGAVFSQIADLVIILGEQEQ
jgi:hypothetical protein